MVVRPPSAVWLAAVQPEIVGGHRNRISECHTPHWFKACELNVFTLSPLRCQRRCMDLYEIRTFTDLYKTRRTEPTASVSVRVNGTDFFQLICQITTSRLPRKPCYVPNMASLTTRSVCRLLVVSFPEFLGITVIHFTNTISVPRVK